MRFNRTQCFAVLLGIAFLVMAGSAFAGTTTANEETYAREVGAVNRVYTLPLGNSLERQMQVIRTNAQDFFVDVTLGNSARFEGAGATLPEAADLTVVGNGTVTYAASIVGGGTDESTTVRYFVDVQQDGENVLPTIFIDTSAWTIKDVANVLGGGGTISVTVSTNDSATDDPFDTSGVATDVWLVGDNAVTAGTLTSTTAVIDVATNRLNFVATAPDTTVTDQGASLAIDIDGAILQANGTAYALLAASTVSFTFSGDLSGITSISWGTNTVAVTAADRTAGSVTLEVPGNDADIDAGAQDFVITVNGTTTLASRTLTVAVALELSGGTDGPVANSRSLLTTSTLTVWSLNGTVLLTNWTNGNNAVFNGRIYLWNPSPVDGAVTVRVFTQPVGFNGGTAESEQLGDDLLLGTLAATSSVNIRVAEDILDALGIELPYTENGGNLVIELTINAANVSGYGQVFSNSFGFGTVPLTVIQ